MTAPTPYVLFPGNAGDALAFYGRVFDCGIQLHTLAELGRTDGPADPSTVHTWFTALAVAGSA